MVDEQFEMGKWKGKDTYKCKLCPFISTSKDALDAHWKGRHRNVAPPPSPVLVADMRGKEVPRQLKKRPSIELPVQEMSPKETKKKPAARPAKPKKVEVKSDGEIASDSTGHNPEVSGSAAGGERS